MSTTRRGLSAMASVGGGGGEDAQLGEFFEYMERLRNFERSGVPRGAGTDSDDGFDLERMRRLLRRLGDPHTHFPAVHIAGTKGKGSTAAFLSNIMREQGYNVGCYSSPHLLSIRERISIGNHGAPVSAGLLRDLFDDAKNTIDESIESENGALTHFEVFTALSFLLFSRENVDIAIVEFIELHDVKLQLLGDHQRQNAVTASCTALCLCNLGNGPMPDVVLLTEASIAGGSSRAMPASSLKEIWIAAAQEQGVDYVDIGTVSGMETPECISNLAVSSSGSGKPMLIGCQDAPFSCDLVKVASHLLESRGAGCAAPGLICVTGSLHLVASVLQQLG
ncbi:hypothetical protein PR202_gb24348 [Eleusine coracana subsp. coracana]|uniref:Mur ligase central domain-containing protein n=1 Tax=Eleusine coracana subsp. coracana TaxID=191504 RepID=A0AAV5FM75_ELECO|nr:hypothetical protein PR202_gb24348 [Eleusine coracana subsp. coracana]